MATYLGHQEDSSGNILLPTPHSMAAQIELGTTASQAYAKGAYVVFNNRLCKASTAIASGNTLAIGTNLVQCSIGSELNSHLQAPNGNEFYFDYKDGKPGFYPSASKVASEFVPFGGTLSETVLWELDPSKQTSSFAKQAVDLSDNINNYDYIAVEFKYSTSTVTEMEISKSIMSVADFKKGVYESSVARNCMAYGILNSSDAPYTRQVRYLSDVSIQFSSCVAMNSTTAANSNAIPLRVIGLK